MKVILSIILFFLFSSSALSSQSMRRCMLLPIKDSLGGAIGFKVYEEIEAYLKESNWCYYKSNSEIINILGNYKSNLSKHLANADVLKVIAEKSRSGSLIRIKITNQVKGVDLEIEIIGENGEDLYFKESTQLKTDDHVTISQSIKNWLDIYSKNIPYDARIIGVLGNQFTIDIGKASSVKQGDAVTILRPIRKKRHPLLKEIVDWETEKIGNGRIFHVAQMQSQGSIERYDTRKRLRVEDWVLIEKNESGVVKEDSFFKDIKKDSFGKVGSIGILLNLGTGSASNITGSTIKKIGGFNIGIDLDTELWITRKFWSGISFGQSFSTYKQKEGTIVGGSNSVNRGVFKFKTGYKYLPMGFFYGPQIDGYIGYSRYKYGLDTQSADGFGEVVFKGFTVGFRGNIPLSSAMRLHLGIEFMLSPNYEEIVTLFGQDDSSSNYQIELGGSYIYSPTMTINLSLNILSNKAKFISPTSREYHLKNTTFKVGPTFTF